MSRLLRRSGFIPKLEEAKPTVISNVNESQGSKEATSTLENKIESVYVSNEAPQVIQRNGIINDSLGITENVEVGEEGKSKLLHHTNVSRVLEVENEDDELDEDVVPDMT